MSAVPPLPVQATGGAASPATAPSAAQLTSTRSSLPRAAAQQANLAGNGSAAKKQPAKEEPQHIFEEEATEGVTSNWEVAYVYAFVTKFTDLRSVATPQSLLTDVTSFENALIESSPPPGSKIAKVAPPPRLYGYANQYGSYLARPPPKMSEMDHDDGGISIFGKEGDEDGSVPSTPAAATADNTEGEDNADSVVADSIVPADSTAVATPATAPEDLLEEEEDPFLHEPIPTASPLLVDIIKVFEGNLYLPEFENSHGRRDWFSWLVRFVNKRLLTFNRGGFEWEYNLLKRVGVKSGSEKEQEFWLLKWEDKIHLLRQMVDYQLMHSHHVRSLIDLHYDLGKQRVSKREPLVNPLVIEKVGKYGRRSIWHLDDTPRLYASSNPFKKEATWNAINSTAEGYARLIEDLPEPDREQWATIQAGKAAAVAQAQAQQQAAAAGGKKAQQAAAAAAAASSPVAAAKPKARGRGKGKNVEEMSQEQLLRAHLEEDWPAVLANEKALDALYTKRTRAADRANNKDHRVAKQLAKLDPYGTGYSGHSYSTGARSTRLRTQSRQVDYVYEGGGAEGLQGQSEGEVSTPRKRGRGQVESEAEGWATEEESASGVSTPASGVGRATPGGSGRRQASKLREEVEWKGERRSSRVQMKRGGVDEGEEGIYEGSLDAEALPPLPLANEDSLTPANPPHTAVDLIKDDPEAKQLKVVDDDESIPAANGHVPPPTTTETDSSIKDLPTSLDLAAPSSSSADIKPVGTDSAMVDADSIGEGVQADLNGAVKSEEQKMEVDVEGAEA